MNYIEFSQKLVSPARLRICSAGDINFWENLDKVSIRWLVR